MEGTVALRQREGIRSCPQGAASLGRGAELSLFWGSAHLILHSLILRNKGTRAWCGQLKAAWNRSSRGRKLKCLQGHVGNVNQRCRRGGPGGEAKVLGSSQGRTWRGEAQHSLS